MKRLIVAAILFAAHGAIAQTQEKCTSAKSYTQLLACAENKSPAVMTALAELEIANAQMQTAGQWQNPELAAETFQGNINNENRTETDISFGVPIEIGGKISARKGAASGRIAVAEAKLYEARTVLKSQVFLKLHRLRQLLHEQQIADEAVSTFTKLIEQYAKRLGLSPEQRISAYVYRLSKSEYEIKRADLNDELLELNSYFKVHLGLTIAEIKNLAPQSPTRWQPAPARPGTLNSPEQKVAQAELDTAQAELSLAQSEAWPTLTLGPSVKLLNEGGQSNNMMGLNLSLPIPVFNLNGGAKASALAAVKLGETRKKLSFAAQELKREELVSRYQESVRALQQSLNHEEIEKRHSEAETLFSKGVVPSALVIEAHRTSYELERARHDREIKAFEALINIYILDGTLMENSL